jgi:hypothetical protein
MTSLKNDFNAISGVPYFDIIRYDIMKYKDYRDERILIILWGFSYIKMSLNHVLLDPIGNEWNTKIKKVKKERK